VKDRSALKCPHEEAFPHLKSTIHNVMS
jgi:hypothetical protein